MVGRISNPISKLAQMGFEKPLIAPSLLAADFLNLGDELKRIESADLLHLDVMDGSFVPNISFGFPIIEAVSKGTRLPLDVHLMIDNPDRYIEEFIKVNAHAITVHFEASKHIHRTLMTIKEAGALAGLALNPGTSFESVVALLPFVDLVLVMSVNPGYGGQSFIPEVLPKIRMLDQYRKNHNKTFLISVDGGINEKNAGVVVQAGADLLVAGSFVFAQKDAGLAIDNLRFAGRTRM